MMYTSSNVSSEGGGRMSLTQMIWKKTGEVGGVVCERIAMPTCVCVCVC